MNLERERASAVVRRAEEVRMAGGAWGIGSAAGAAVLGLSMTAWLMTGCAVAAGAAAGGAAGYVVGHEAGEDEAREEIHEHEHEHGTADHDHD